MTLPLKHVGIVAIALLVAILLAKQQGPTSAGSNSETSLWQFTSPDVRLSEYSRLTTGMSYWEVRGIIGSAGEETARNRIDGIPGVMESIDTVMYSWANDDGSNMNAIFQNDRLTQKAQFGLR